VRRTTVIFTLALAAAICLSSAMTQAQTPAGTAFSYQGRLTDNGVAANGTYDLQFTLFDADTAGNAIGTPIVKDDVTISGGLFTVMLDFGAAFDGHARWIEIGVRPGASSGAFTTLGARQPIAPAPHALFSESSATSVTATTSATSASTPWSGITGVPAGFADGVDNDTLGALTCPLGQIPKSTGGAWVCDIDGDNSATQWNLAGNAGTGGTAVLGTTDFQPFELRVNNQRALRIVPTNNPFNTSTLIGGFSGNTAVGDGVTIAGGGGFALVNSVTNDYGTVGGGLLNQAAGLAVVSGGENNTAGGTLSTVSGGLSNQATGHLATVPGGANNTAAGSFSFAAGNNASARHTGSFVWADSQSDPGSPVASTNTDQFIVGASHGVWFGPSSASPTFPGYLNTGTGAYLTNGGVWTNASDRNLKEHFTPVDGRALLDTLAHLPVTRWNYKTERGVQHIGPTAQDFQAAFGLGGDAKTITTLDPSGIALRAIQELDRANRELRDALAAQAREIESLKAQVASLTASHASR
jgi:hypothetical protein